MKSPVRSHAEVLVARFVMRGNNHGSLGFRLFGRTYTDLDVLLADNSIEFDVSDSASNASCVYVVSDSKVEVMSSGSWGTGNKRFRFDDAFVTFTESTDQAGRSHYTHVLFIHLRFCVFL
ncbi:hypothetical protein DPMN_125320 [Dreissena polymorpha]|uniref:Uncharacterized protein n=1 Tax=Dreissena polymorpha TaxID=45954 RepID=A0A9D4GY13_DREPO|nr:hypothetical protein DPMN_125320 [Dreissena polymorpha]